METRRDHCLFLWVFTEHSRNLHIWRHSRDLHVCRSPHRDLGNMFSPFICCCPHSTCQSIIEKQIQLCFVVFQVMSAMKVALQQSQNSGGRKECKRMSAEASPDSKCPICLDVFNNISYLDICLHKFCFRCIHEWSKNKAECPLCKQPFNSIYHSIKSENDFKQYDLRPLENGSFGIFGGVRFRYRTTLTGINQQRRGRTSLLPDNGVMFESSTNAAQQPQSRFMRNMMLRLAARRVAASEGRTVSSIREQEMINFRRELYRRGVRVRSVTDGGRSRDISAEFFRRNPACLHRLIPWLKRELTVLYGGHGSLVNIVQHMVMSQITRYDMDDGAVEEELRPFLQGRSEHFLHEFISFAKSPFDMQAYDRHAVYDCPGPSSNEDSSPNSSVIAISEDEEQPVDLDLPGEASSLRYSAWDDETPGPSYSTTAQPSRTEYMSVLDSDSDSSSEETLDSGAGPQQLNYLNMTNTIEGEVNKEECMSSDSDECVIIGFTKPLAERTPELVKLSSDSEDPSDDDDKEISPLPQHIRFSSLSPIASRSTDQSSAGQFENLEMDDSRKGCSPAWYRDRKCTRSDRNDRRRRSESSDRLRDRYRSKDGHWRRSRSDKRRYSRSPAVSHSRDRGSFYFRERHYANSADNRHRYSQERSYRSMYTQDRHSYSDRHSCSRSWSRESHKWHRRRSRSRSYSGSPSPSSRKTRHPDKPGGKRKYKARHLDMPSDNALLPSHEKDSSPASVVKAKKKSNKKHRKRSKERSRRSGSRSLEPPDGDSCERSRRHHKKKKKKHKKSKRHKSAERRERDSASVITIDSDSELGANDAAAQAGGGAENPPVPDAPLPVNSPLNVKADLPSASNTDI